MAAKEPSPWLGRAATTTPQACIMSRLFFVALLCFLYIRSFTGAKDMVRAARGGCDRLPQSRIFKPGSAPGASPHYITPAAHHCLDPAGRTGKRGPRSEPGRQGAHRLLHLVILQVSPPARPALHPPLCL
jgi:hypothetical protein